MNSSDSLTYDRYWYGANDQRFEQAFSSVSAISFPLAALNVLYPFLGWQLLKYNLYLALLLLHMSITAFWKHAIGNSENETWNYLDDAAQVLIFTQITVWSVLGHRKHFRYSWFLPYGPAYAMFFLPPALETTWAFLLWGVSTVALTRQEWYGRRRFWGLGLLFSLSVFLGICFVLAPPNDPETWLGRFGHFWIHVTEGFLVAIWHRFWIQSEERLLECGCGSR
jgi:hypothetical protein